MVRNASACGFRQSAAYGFRACDRRERGISPFFCPWQDPILKWSRLTVSNLLCSACTRGISGPPVSPQRCSPLLSSLALLALRWFPTISWNRTLIIYYTIVYTYILIFAITRLELYLRTLYDIRGTAYQLSFAIKLHVIIRYILFS